MKLKIKSLSAIISTLGLVATIISAPAAFAQQPPNQTWFKVCKKVADSDVCSVQFEFMSGADQFVTAVNLLQSKGGVTRRVFQVAVPTGRYIPAGIVIQIDSGKISVLPYSLCMPKSCMAEAHLSDQLILALRRGSVLKLTSTNFRGRKHSVRVPLGGFTGAFDGPPVSVR